MKANGLKEREQRVISCMNTKWNNRERKREAMQVEGRWLGCRERFG